MTYLVVSSLADLPATVEKHGALDVLTLINVGTPVERPTAIAENRHLFIGINDIVEPMDGHMLPAEEHVRQFLDFVQSWDRAKPIVIHCYAGISRSTAALFIAACALKPMRDEAEIARTLRSASAFATPNRLLVEIADRMLGREGRMVSAIAAIGRGAEAFEGEPFCLTLE